MTVGGAVRVSHGGRPASSWIGREGEGEKGEGESIQPPGQWV